jgi:hypothetical protein
MPSSTTHAKRFVAISRNRHRDLSPRTTTAAGERGCPSPSSATTGSDVHRNAVSNGRAKTRSSSDVIWRSPAMASRSARASVYGDGNSH